MVLEEGVQAVVLEEGVQAVVLEEGVRAAVLEEVGVKILAMVLSMIL